MSNHLRELIDVVEGNDPIFFDHMTDAQMDHVAALFSRASSEAVSFFAGSLDDVLGFKIIKELARLPFPVVWIESSGDYGQGVAVLCQVLWANENGNLNAQVFRKLRGVWRYLFAWEIRDEKYIFGHRPDGVNEDFLCLPVNVALKFLSALNCSNINRIENNPPGKLQKARTKRGKQPLFSYWTLEIDLTKSRAAGEDYAGTHASPRLHLRRGHPRQYSPGKWCWVQPCAVGNKNLGMVHKDYAVNHAGQ